MGPIKDVLQAIINNIPKQDSTSALLKLLEEKKAESEVLNEIGEMNMWFKVHMLLAQLQHSKEPWASKCLKIAMGKEDYKLSLVSSKKVAKKKATKKKKVTK